MRWCSIFAAAALAAGQERFAGSPDLDRVIGDAITARQIPGAVALVGQNGQILHRAAYGSRATVPVREVMTVDTVFDAASLTKVVATAAAVMKLFERGLIRLSDPVTAYLPEFQGGKSDITIRHLLTHFSGLRPDVDLKPEWSGYDTGVQLALIDKPTAQPGERFIYSDINYILLGEIVRRTAGRTLPEFVRDEVWLPLGMKNTTYQPPETLRPLIAPTEYREGTRIPLRGVVHDPTTRAMGGIAGHAGVFTTAGDLARFARMMLGHGELDGVRVFQEATVRKFTEPASPPNHTVLRTLGLDMESPYSSNRGELFPVGSFGHTGFTGTSIWIDPSSNAYVILLTNSVHPVRRSGIIALRSKVATIAAVHMGLRSQKVSLTGYNETMVGVARPINRTGAVKTGIDVLVSEKFARLRGKRVGLLTNHTGITATGQRNIDAMVAAGVQLTAILSPEHGISGTEDREDVASGKDAATGLPVFSLYRGQDRRPPEDLMRKIDVLVFDIQDVGARFYTYTCSMLNAMEVAAKTGVPMMVLDRPNPVTGTRVEGPVADEKQLSFVGCYTLPLRHGMTLGEIATMVNAEKSLGVKLEVVKMDGWQRGDWWDSTGLIWLNPSPNIRSLNAALLFPAVAMIEYSRNYTVGRGTDSPFEQAGADWIEGPRLAAYLNSRGIPGIRVYPVRFRPESSNLSGKTVEGVRFVITQREAFSPFQFGTELISALRILYPGRIVLETNRKLLANDAYINALDAGIDPRTILQQQAGALEAFLERRRRFLLY